MKFYLRYINPALALVVLALCVWAAVTQDRRTPNLAGIVAGGFGTYFFAKGLFCSAALFLSGVSLLRRWESDGNASLYGWKEIMIVVAIAGAATGGLYAYRAGADQFQDKRSTSEESAANPKELEITDLTAIPQTQFLSITGKVKNASSTAWKSITIEADVFHGATFSAKVERMIVRLKPGESQYFVLESSNLRTEKMLDSLRYKVEVTGTPETDSVKN